MGSQITCLMKKVDHLITTGIKGLDQICKGGIRANSSILVTGVPGAGKTIFGLQFVYGGAKNGEAGLIITTEETVDSIRINAKTLGMDFEKYEKNGLITIVEQKVFGGKIISMEAPMNVIRKKKIKRVVLDSLNVFEYIFKSGSEDYKRGLLQFISDLKEVDITFLAVTDRATTSFDSFHYKPEDSLFEGMVVLTKIRKSSSFERCLHVAKLRGQEHGLDIYPFCIGKGGITVYPKEIPFSLAENE